MELAFAGLQQLCAPMLDRLERLPGPAARRARHGVRAAGGRRAGSLPRRSRGVESAVRGGRGPAAALPRRRRAVAGSGLGAGARPSSRAACWRSRSAWSSRRAREATSDELDGLPELVLDGLRDGDARALLRSVIRGPLDERVRERIVAETRGNPLALLELPRGLTPAELAGGFGLPTHPPLTGRIEDSFRRRLESLPAGPRQLLLVAAAEPAGDRCCSGARPIGSGSAPERQRRADRGRPARVRRARAVPASARALGRLPGGSAGGPPARPRGAGGGDRSRGRSRSSCLASRAGGGRARRGRRGGARALRGPGAAPRRRRRRGRVPGAGDRADARAGAPGPARSGRGADQARCGRAGCRPRTAGAPRRRDRWTSSIAPVSTCCAPRSRSPRAAATTRPRCSSRPPGVSSRSTPRSRAIPTWKRSPRRSSPAAWPAGPGCGMWPRPHGRRPVRAPRAPPTFSSTASPC